MRGRGGQRCAPRARAWAEPALLGLAVDGGDLPQRRERRRSAVSPAEAVARERVGTRPARHPQRR
eukprot:4088585-Pleurochrysis_carterae.AAC.1